MQTTDTPMALSRGQSYAAHFKRGAVITVAAGSVRVISRVWLDHSSLTTQTPMLRGGVLCVPCAGWLEISADSDARVGLGQPSGGLKLIKRGWRVLAGICERFRPLALVLYGQEAMN